MSLLAFEPRGRPDLALNYLEAVELLDQNGELILGAYDRLSSLCLNLSDDEEQQLKSALRNEGVLEEVILPVQECR